MSVTEAYLRAAIADDHQLGACAVHGCPRPRRARGMCAAHYQQWRRTGVVPTQPVRPRRKHAHCAYDMNNVYCYWGEDQLPLCTYHYQRAFRTGDPKPHQPKRVLQSRAQQ
jgi:hypothetical protein